MKLHDIALFEAKSFKKSKYLAIVADKLVPRMQRDLSIQAETADDFIDSIEKPSIEQNIYQIIYPYMKWIIARYISGGIRQHEDIMATAIPNLLKYNKLKLQKKLEADENDINRIKDLTTLVHIVRAHEEKGNLDPKKGKGLAQKFIEEGDAELLYNDDEIKIVSPKTQEASCFFGKNTQWCTAASTSHNFFDSYDRDGPLYILLVKEENTRYQFHFERGEYTDEENNELDSDEIYDLRHHYPQIKEVLKTWPIGDEEPSDESIIHGLITDGSNVYENGLSKWITSEHELEAISRNPDLVDYYTPSNETIEKLIEENYYWMATFIESMDLRYDDERAIDFYKKGVAVNDKAVSEIELSEMDEDSVKEIIDANPYCFEYIDLEKQKISSEILEWFIYKHKKVAEETMDKEEIKEILNKIEIDKGQWPTINDPRQLSFLEAARREMRMNMKMILS